MNNVNNYFTIHPHIGFLNTDFTMWSNHILKEIEITILPENIRIKLPSCRTHILRNLEAGEHIIQTKDTDGTILQEEKVFVENSIKVGSSTVSKKVVTNNWIILIMKDRCHFHNKKTKEEFIEYKIHPDDIIEITSQILCSVTRSNYLFYTIDDIKTIEELKKHDVIYFNCRWLVYKSDEKYVVISDYIKKEQIEYDSFYFSERLKKLYLLKDDKLTSYNFSKDLIIKKNISIDNISKFILDHHYISVNEELITIQNIENSKDHVVFSVQKILLLLDIKKYDKLKVETINKGIRIDNNIINNNIIIEILYVTQETAVLKVLKFSISYLLFICNDDYKLIFYDKIEGFDLKDLYCIKTSLDSGEKHIYIIKEDAIRIIKNATLHLYKDTGVYEIYNSESNSYTLYNLYGDELCQCKGLILFGFKEYGLIIIDGVYYYYSNNSMCKVKEKMNDFPLRNIVACNGGFYYYQDGNFRPLPYKLNFYEGNENSILNFENNEWNLLEWDYKLNKYMHSCIFSDVKRSCVQSAIFNEDGTHVICKKEDQTIIRYNIETGEEEEFFYDTSVFRNYNASQLLVSEDKHRRVVFKDPISLKTITPECLSEYGFFSIDNRYTVTYGKNNGLVKRGEVIENEKKIRYNYIKVCDKYLNEDLEIRISDRISNINYITFSYNSKYIVIVGATTANGYILIYDIENNHTVFEYPNVDFAKSHKPHFISGAIWIASFNEKGDLIIYNSSPNTFVFKGSENYLSHSVINKRNFLCFSPSGKYFALSTQGYNPYSSGAINWGHQSSTKVYIRSIDNLGKEIGPYEDIGNGNITKTNKQNIGTVAFSKDESKLLVVSSDGSFVVRHLNLFDENSWK